MDAKYMKKTEKTERRTDRGFILLLEGAVRNRVLPFLLSKDVECESTKQQ